MSRREALGVGVGAGLGLATAASLSGGSVVAAQTPQVAGDFSGTRTTLTLDGAMAMVEAARAKATDMGKTMVIVIVDESGVLKAFARMDGTGVASIDLSRAKAYTAAAFRTPTHQLAERVAANPAQLASFTNAPNVILLGGGFPIQIGDAVVGGIGCGGGTPEEDMQVAQAGLAALGG